jgi:membrane protein DedA with SNARE-associated domain
VDFVGSLIAACLLVWLLYVLLKDAESQTTTAGKVTLVVLAILMVAGVLYEMAKP